MTTFDVQTQVVTKTTDEDDRLVHIVLKSERPKALCGHIITDEWVPGRKDTRERCYACLKIAQQLGYRWDAHGNPR